MTTPDDIAAIAATDTLLGLADRLTDQECAYVLVTPLQEPSDAGVIAYCAGERIGGGRFAAFARKNLALFDRKRNYAGTAYEYRLSATGRDLAAALRARAYQEERP